MLYAVRLHIFRLNLSKVVVTPIYYVTVIKTTFVNLGEGRKVLISVGCRKKHLSMTQIVTYIHIN